ncbi:transcription termination/antitermination protein NusG, partial [Nocardia sp. BSTN01]|nr:transcription termination/antitermination protein NusG [Nocardia sp. BSTN01]
MSTPENGTTDEFPVDDEAAETAVDEATVSDGTEASSGEVEGDADETGTDASAEPAAPEEPADPVAEMKAALRRAPGDWYVIHSYAGYENKVKTNLE